MTEQKEQELIREIMKRQKQLADIRYQYEDIWDDVAYFGCSRRPDFRVEKQEGTQRFTSKIYDGTPNSALNLWVDGMQGYHISPALEWFNYRVGGYNLRPLNEHRDVRFWLQDLRELVYWELNESNFYNYIREFLLDGGSIGNANLFINEDIVKKELEFEVRHPRQLFFIENNKGEVDILHRKFELDARQAVLEYGEDNVSEKIKLAHESNRLGQKFEFIQATYPINDYIPQTYDSELKPYKKFNNYISYHIEVDAKILLKRQGIRLFNPVIWRMKKYSGETYGRGLLGDAISEVKRLNSASRSEMLGVQLSAEPPLNIPFEMKDDIDITPHGQNYYRDAQRVVIPMNMGNSYPVTEDYINRLQAAVERHFQVEFFLMLARAEGTMTATEIIEKQGEKIALMTSQFNLLNKKLSEIHDKILNVLNEQNKLPPVPSVLLAATGGKFPIDVDYVGPLAEAQKRLFKARGIRQSLEVAAPYIQMFPGIMDTIDDVKLAKKLFITHGMPEDVMREEEEIQAIRQNRSQQQQRMFEAEIAEKEAKVARNIQQPVEEGSIMQKMLGEE